MAWPGPSPRASSTPAPRPSLPPFSHTSTPLGAHPHAAPFHPAVGAGGHSLRLPIALRSAARPIKDPTAVPKSGPREIKPPPGKVAAAAATAAAAAPPAALDAPRAAPPTPFPVHARAGTLPNFLTGQEREVRP